MPPFSCPSKYLFIFANIKTKIMGTKQSHRRQLKITRYHNFLNDLYEHCDKQTTIGNWDLMNKHQVDGSTLKVLRERGVIKQAGKEGRTFIYKWDTLHPTRHMAISVVKEVEQYHERKKANREQFKFDEIEQPQQPEIDFEHTVPDIRIKASDEPLTRDEMMERATAPFPNLEEPTQAISTTETVSWFWGLYKTTKKS